MMNAPSHRWTMIVSVLMGGLLAGYMVAAGGLTSLLRSYGWLRQLARLVLGPGG